MIGAALRKGKAFMELAGSFRGKNKAIFLASVAAGMPGILRDKTVLTMKFVKPMALVADGRRVYASYFYEVPFYTYDYRYITSLIEDKSVVFDIGAHFGEVSYRFLKKKKGYCYMFEPNPSNAHVIERMFHKEEMNNFSLKQFGLGSKAQTSYMYLTNPLSYEGSITKKQGRRTKIVVKKFDDLRLSMHGHRNAFFKIDVEGFEVAVIEGMLKSLAKMKRSHVKIKMIIEIKNAADALKITALLKQALGGMKVKKLNAEDYLFTATN